MNNTPIEAAVLRRQSHLIITKTKKKKKKHLSLHVKNQARSTTHSKEMKKQNIARNIIFPTEITIEIMVCLNIEMCLQD
jgi:hypothetical protein